ncbi:MAG: hypothetical protein LBM93_00615 [Oscillospiraceae bacterium]|nr:hypothetical protein [Oscillospiraceae bacterium]
MDYKRFETLSLSDEEYNHYKANEIDYKKKHSKLINKARESSKPEKCYICGKQCSSFCNSHSIPRFILKNISDNGMIHTPAWFIKNIPFVDKEVGINKTGVFKIICKECDSKVFTDYENEDNYKSIPTQIMLSQIALKNSLKQISKKQLESQLHQEIPPPLNISSIEEMPLEPILQYMFAQFITDILDTSEAIDDYDYAQEFLKILSKSNDYRYHIGYSIKLDYVVPYAFQSQIMLTHDLYGSIINRNYDMSPEYRIQNIDICVFPLKETSQIFIFTRSDFTRYSKFYEQLNKLSQKDALSIINYIILVFSEEVYFNPNINLKLSEEKELSDCIAKVAEIIDIRSVSPNEVEKNHMNRFSFSNHKNIPNLLSLEFQIKGE